MTATIKESPAQALEALGFTVEAHGSLLIVNGRLHYMTKSNRWIDESTAEGGRGLNSMVAYLRRVGYGDWLNKEKTMANSEARWCVEEEATGMPVAQGTAPTADEASREATHYALQYGQDGPVRWWVRQGRKTIVKGRFERGVMPLVVK